MALMVFLVCTVIASITITAATAASGRIARLRDSERSYYHVSSAANLVWDILQGEASNGLEVEVAYGCDAEWDDTSGWAADRTSEWLQIDGEYLSARSGGGDAGSTLFEVLTCNVLFGNDATGTDLSALVVDLDKVFGNEITWTDEEPSQPEPSFINNAYDDAVTIPPPATMKSGYAFGDDDVVKLTVAQKDDGTFEFVFTDAGSRSSSPATYVIVASVDVTHEPVEGTDDPKGPGITNRLSWTSDVIWTPLSIEAGGAA
ncbi:MAG: hypothetical protein IKG18_06705 [Atopobiaceae bacterium]|nr:hypothetical protein [Atopobiaceae bacterium]